MNNKKRILKSRKKLARARKRLIKELEERKWIENNPQINIWNYPFYKTNKIVSDFVDRICRDL